VVVVESGGRMLAIQVDDVLTQQQVVIKPLSDGVGKSALLSGAAILSDGRVGLILNVDRIVELFAKPPSTRQDFSEAAE
jgi:two-component system chemotaxis sensor kinase CheA